MSNYKEEAEMNHIFIIGSKGIPARYGGFETFVEELVSRQVSKDLQYHVACMSSTTGIFQYMNAQCFNIKVPSIGPAKAIYYDLLSLKYCIKKIKAEDLKDSIVYVLACRIGPFFGYYVKQLHQLNCKIYINPDGHEWKRAKWNLLIKKYWKFSEKLMVKHTDLLICDSVNIEKYIKKDYKLFCPKTTFIPYGAEIMEVNDIETLNKLKNWYTENNIKEKEYYLIVGRFVPENNYELMIKGFMASNTRKDLVIVTNIERNKYYKSLLDETHFDKDPRIKFVGTVYNQKLLSLIRQKAFAYIHGHSVGGTNPSLLEALASTDLNFLYDVNFNREVGGKAVLYFKDDLSYLINEAELKTRDEINKMSVACKNIISMKYNWDKIIAAYELRFRKD